MAVSSAVSTSLSSAMICGSPFTAASHENQAADVSCIEARGQPSQLRAQGAAERLSRRSSISSRQHPQSLPAPSRSAMAASVCAPASMAASSSRSVTARQMQRTIDTFVEIEIQSQYQEG
jgi:hypothetical protein